ncbi:DUF1330 domain-containing protein [Albimonas pacifica]|uniref:Uncharacterized conserved protein, DUF1330 family n=1 Tax=Albimonas pacifica TaxID=1114924 RepID=A0A1I3HQ67_9RHOB|nr:DUF1330 domain-containing protein [Albimonas pacifica]SFI37906.1 Uncharacterized conserved protein, DUF1330 family [Albimonas pacifica]
MTDAPSPDRCVDPDRAQWEAFKALPRDEPVQMLNLVRFRESAAYPEGHALAGRGLTGAQAYAEYGRESGPVFAGLGGRIVWRGGFRTVLIGPQDERWDEVFVAAYPAASAFIEMMMNPDYQKAVVHRQAAVLTSRLIRTAPAEAGGGFAFG